MQSKKTNQQDKIEPPEGWIIQSVYGTLKDARGNCLVRLEDVHAWLMTNKEQSSASAATWIFSAFNSDAGSPLGMLHGAAAVRTTLRILHPAENAAEYGDYSGRLFFKELDAHFPYLPHHRLDRDSEGALIYAMGIAAGHLWAPALRDCNEADLNELLGGYGPEGDFPSCAICRNLLGRLAVSFQAAHTLWDWGSVANVVQLQSVDVPIEKEPTNFTQLGRFRKDHPGSEWTPNQKEVLVREARTRREKPGAQRVIETIAKELGVSVSFVNTLIREAKLRGKRADARSRAV